MSFTLEDLKEILKENKEDMRHEIKQLKEELKENTTKVIKTEVEKAVMPVVSRHSEMEKKQDDLTEKVTLLTEQMKKVQEGLESNTQTKEAGVARSMAARLFGRQTETGNEEREGRRDMEAQRREERVHEDDIKVEKAKELFKTAKQTLGLSPIDKKDVERFMKEEHGGLNEEDAKEAAVKEYMEMEMRMKPEIVIEVMKDVEKIFEPKKDEWNTLYISFSSEVVADKVLRHTTYMKKGKRAGKVQHYIPRALYARYSALEKRAAEMRRESNKTINTRVALQEHDFKLLWRPKNQKQSWIVEPHPEGLPGFQLDTVGGTLHSPARTPPKGRERYREEEGGEEEGREEEAGSHEEEGSGSNKRRHSPVNQEASKRSKEQEEGRGQEQGRGLRSSPPLVQVDIHPPGSPGLGLQNRRLSEHVTVRKDSRRDQL